MSTLTAILCGLIGLALGALFGVCWEKLSKDDRLSAAEAVAFKRGELAGWEEATRRLQAVRGTL